MAIRRVSAPELEPVTLEEAKDHLNVDYDDKDALIESYISAARALIENSCHIVIAEALFELTYDAFPDEAIEIPRFPLIAVESVIYDDGDGNAQTLSADAYTVDASGQFGWVVVNDSWPATLDAINAVRVRFRAGYAMESGNESNMPPEFKQAILLLVGHFFQNREAVGDSDQVALPLAVEALISPHRVPVLA